MTLIDFIPPLRLILTNSCNGGCYYCHHEGYYDNTDMPLSIIRECAKIASDIKIPIISLTGGEPSLRKDLPLIINEIYQTYPSVQLNLTSNGYNLLEVCDGITTKVSMLNLSFTSFKIDIVSKYQNVDPRKALKALEYFPSYKKKLNVLITHNNIDEIKTIINYCETYGFSIDLLFELKEYSNDDYNLQRKVFKIIESYGPFRLELKSTPTIYVDINQNCRLSIKHPKLNNLIRYNICSNCDKFNECYERICSVRVYPNSSVSPCLNNHIKIKHDDLSKNINEIYKKISLDTSVFDLMISNIGSIK